MSRLLMASTSIAVVTQFILATSQKGEPVFPEGLGFNSHPGQSFSLSLCGPIPISKANAHMVDIGLKTSTSHYTLIFS